MISTSPQCHVRMEACITNSTIRSRLSLSGALAGGLRHHVVLQFAETNYVNSTTYGSSKLALIFIKGL